MKLDDLISRAALLKDLSYCAPELWQDEEYIKAKIMKQHAVDAVPVVHGRWIQADLDEDYVTCSRCKANGSKDRMAWTPEFAEILKYCPHCGARMDGERRDT